MDTREGCAVVSDQQTGSLLFYTNGENVWNSNHTVMPNGSGLMGHWSSAQSAIIVKKPGSDSLFYIFTVPAAVPGPSDGLRYSIVNMSLDGGLGDVDTTGKNISLLNPASEQLTAIRHANCDDVWILTHEHNTNAYYAFLVTDTGVSSSPVISNAGAPCPGSGTMKSSPDSKKLALAINNVPNEIILCNFDNTIGTISYWFTFPTASISFSFSPDNSKLYVSRFVSIEQFDLSSNDTLAILISRTTLVTGTGYYNLQLAPDGKIYAAQFNQTYLGVINDPDVAGLGCNYVDTGFPLAGRVCEIGLPAFINDNFQILPEASFTDTTLCLWDSTTFISNSAFADSWVWGFGDPAVGPNENISFLENPKHLYAYPGSYVVTLAAKSGCKTDTFVKMVNINGTPFIDLGEDTLLCDGDSLLLDATTPNATYLWQDGSVNPGFIAKTSGTYWVAVFTGNCFATDSIRIGFENLPYVFLGNDTALCSGLSLLLDASYQNATYLWQDGTDDPTYDVTASGLYRVIVATMCGNVKDSIQITFYPLPRVSLGKDTSLCQKETLTLDITTADAIYQWQDGSVAPIYLVVNPGSYWIEVSVNGCSDRDTINIDYSITAFTGLGKDTVLCEGQTLRLNATVSGSTYLWQDGSISSIFEAATSQDYWVNVTDQWGCLFSDTIKILLEECKQPIFVPNAFTPNGDGQNDFLQVYFPGNTNTLSMNFFVFDRWGEKVFHTNNPLHGWDGSYRGTKMSAGVYAYYIHGSYFDGTSFEMKGSVTLLR